MKKTAFPDLVSLLTNGQPTRVWSLLLTVFGELAQGEDAKISSTLLGRLSALMGIKPEAMRVALHRLRKDGWLQSERIGRISAYSLTDWGRSQSADATPRIYDLHPTPSQAWLALYDLADPLRGDDSDGVWVAANLLMTVRPPTHGRAYVMPVLPDAQLPDWMSQNICQSELVALTQEFHGRLAQVQIAIAHVQPMDDLEVSVLRILIVDGWRRIALRAPQLPAHVFPDDWMGQPCRETVAAILSTYEKQSIGKLEAAL